MECLNGSYKWERTYGQGFCVVASLPAWEKHFQMMEKRHCFLHTLSRSSKKVPPPQSWGGVGVVRGQNTESSHCRRPPPPYQECQLAPGPCTFLPSVSKVGDSLATTKGQNKTLYKFCSQITVLWAIPFFQILYPLWTAHGNSWMIQATGWDSLFRKSFLGVSLYAQGTA